MSCPEETHFNYNNRVRLKVKRWEKIYHAEIIQKKADVAILISNKLSEKKRAVM